MAPYLPALTSRVLCTMGSFSSIGALLFWVLILHSFTRVSAMVCVNCGGNAPGCAGDSDKCPLVVDPVSNAKALVAVATGTVLAVANLLPAKIQRCLDKVKLETLKAIANYKQAPTVYDFTKKTVKDLATVMRDTLAGRVTVNETMTWCTELMLDTKTDGSEAGVIAQIKAVQDNIRHVASTKGITTDKASMLDGVHLYVWALTDTCAKSSETVIMHALDSEDKDTKDSGGKAKIVRPKTASEFHRRLNLWVMLLAATGVANALITTAFLEDVVYSTLEMGTDWTVVHELFLVYLQYVANHASVSLQTVFATGGQDVKFREAESNAKVFFRTGGGGPRTKIQESGAAKAWNCECTGVKGKKCISINLKQNHLASSLDGSGKCQFVHECDRFLVDDDGEPTNEQCGGSHPRADCDNPKRVGA